MRRLLTALVAAFVLTSAPVATARAVPDTGAGADTPGTSASISPSTLRAGDTLRFRVTGFPAGEVVNVKIDDGRFCAEAGVHGACVVHQQRIGADGSVAGSLVLPADLRPGRHWLRFLASQEMTDAAGNYLGVKGFTLRGSSDFTVAAGSSNAAPESRPDDSPADAGSDEAATGQEHGSLTDEVVAAGRSLRLTLPDGVDLPDAPRDPAPEAEASETPGVVAQQPPSARADGEPAARPRASDASDTDPMRFPWLGTGVLVAAGAVAGLVLRRGLRARG